MGEVHNMILEKGIDFARKAARSKRERQIVDTAFSVLSDGEFKFSVLHKGFAFATLPHRASKNTEWRRRGRIGGERITLHIESGHSDGEAIAGIPYGSISRLILIYLFNEAFWTKKRQVNLDRAMMSFLREMSISRGGKSIRMVRDQTRRIALCKLSFFTESPTGTLTSIGAVTNFNSVTALDEHLPGQPHSDAVELDEELFDGLMECPILLREAAIRNLFGRSMAMDLYVFLAYRLHLLDAPIFISWTDFYTQFGGSYREEWVFIREVREPLELALAAYPEANVEITELGLILQPSASPVRQVSWLKKTIGSDFHHRVEVPRANLVNAE